MEAPTLAELFLFVSDLQASKDFYLDKLKFRASVEGKDFIVLDAGGSRILLHDSAGETFQTGDVAFEFRVDDVDRLHRELSRQGVRFQRVPFEVSHEGDPWSPRREARVRDPDGYGPTIFSPLRP